MSNSEPSTGGPGTWSQPISLALSYGEERTLTWNLGGGRRTLGVGVGDCTGVADVVSALRSARTAINFILMSCC